MTLSVAERRTISTRALFDPDFRSSLVADPHEAVSEALGHPLPAGLELELIEESADSWAFVMLPSAAIAMGLPEALDARAAVENDVYTVLRDDPQAIIVAKNDPVAFMRDRFGLEIQGVALYEETAGRAMIVLPNNAAATGEELSDDMLDLVSAGGDPNCQSGYIKNPYNSNPSPR